MDFGTRLGAPVSFPHNPDAFEHLNTHANRLLDFHRYDCHYGFFKFPIARSPWTVVTRVAHERDEESDDKYSAEVAAAKAVGNPLPPSPPQKLHFTWGVEYVNEQPNPTATTAAAAGASAAAPAAAPAKPRSNVNGVKARILRGDAGTVFKASVENDGTVDGVLEHRVSRHFSFKTYGLYYDAPNSSLLGMNLRLDGSIWNADLKLNTDGGVGGLSAAVQPIAGTVVGCEAFYIRAEKGPIYALGVKQQLPLARWLKPSAVSFTATSLGSLVGSYSAPLLTDRLKVATRFGYDLATFDSHWGVGAECWPLRMLFGTNRSGQKVALDGTPLPAAATATAAKAGAVPVSDAKSKADAAAPSSDAASPLHDLKVQAMVDPYSRYAVQLSVPVNPHFYVAGSVSKRWTSTSMELPTLALSFNYE